MSETQVVRVLFADDSDSTIAVFREVTQRLGWQGIYVSNAVEIMDTVNKLLTEGQNLDAVVADIAFLSGPKLTGITAAREIRKVMPNVPIIFISAYVTSIIKEEVRRVDAEILKKPIDVNTLFVRLNRLILWNRTVASKDYTGTERRRQSVNRTDNCRRATDYTLSTPTRIAETLEAIQEEQNERGQNNAEAHRSSGNNH